jgi:hypothetical protein
MIFQSSSVILTGEKTVTPVIFIAAVTPPGPQFLSMGQSCLARYHVQLFGQVA